MEGSFNSAANSITDSYITPFLLSLGATNGEIGLSGSVKNFATVLAQLPGAKMTDYMSRKKVWIIASFMTRFFWIPIILIPLLIPNPVMLVMLMLAISAFFLTLKSPAWSSMMGDIVPMQIRGIYFGKRNMIMGFCGLIATVLAGIILTEYGFSMILITSIVLGLVSIIFFVLINEPRFKKTYVYKHEISLHPKDIITGIRLNKNFSFFTIYMMFTNFAVEIGSPFVAVYMLQNISVGYEWFAILVAAGALSKTIFYKYWGKLADRHGNRKVMLICGILISFVPFGYMLSSNLAHLFIVGIFNGFAWAGFDNGVFNFLLDITPSNKRPGYVANYTILIGMGAVAGDLVGAYLAQTSDKLFLLGFYGLQVVFLVSFVLRMAVLPMLSKIKEVEVRQTEVAPVRYIIWEAAAIEPAKDIKYAIHYAFRHSHRIVSVKNKINLDLQNMHFKREKLLELPDQPHQKTDIHVTVEDLECFSDVDRVVKDAEKGYTIFVYTVGMREKSIDELEHAVVRIREGCEKVNSQVYFADEDWLIVLPKNMKLETD